MIIIYNGTQLQGGNLRGKRLGGTEDKEDEWRQHL